MGNEVKKTVSVPSEIAQNLKVAEEDDSARYDEAARNLVAQKPILAYILKSALDEYAEYTVQEIAEKFIVGTPEVRKIAVHPDHPDKTAGSGMMSGDDKIEGLPTVDKSQREGTVYFDIRFLVIHPVSEELLEIFINIEIQNDDTPGYPIPKRGDFHEEKQAYDLMTVVVLRLGSKGVNSGDNAIRLLSKMFSMDLNYSEKLDALENEFQISASREISEEVQEVCNLSTGVFNKAYDKGYGSGYDSGYDSGISAGEMRKARDMAYKLHDTGMSNEEIANTAEVSIDTIQEWLAEREKMLV